MNRIAMLRKEKGLSQSEFAEVFQVTQQTISAYEKGKRDPDSNTLRKMADYFDVSIDYLLCRTNDRNPSKQTYSKEELTPLVPEEYRELFASQNIKYIEFAKKMKKEEIDPDDLIEGLKIYIEVKKKYKNK
ncbi:helix-turn-helix domain-containing protein [Wukongibacter sp. M2B1]|uniref:helix-turn-helix domain-containing protein n=1 Tax=Wukongibacter sp. M2B1 TaxID=3088895 RepID=UPI003D7AB428